VAAVVATSAELQERAALKQVGMTAAMAEALGARAVVGPGPRLAAELGSLALKEGFAAWVSADIADDPWRADCAELDRLRTTAAHL
jgi:hypothetical protein